ncbi:hypothetical protein MKEN_00012900 [Mycena kentingensis (nom. inval.)]|nr:hypothetical protein MKEN_00012900 [Mycena kentingensis (nom. inval.)]
MLTDPTRHYPGRSLARTSSVFSLVLLIHRDVLQPLEPLQAPHLSLTPRVSTSPKSGRRCRPLTINSPTFLATRPCLWDANNARGDRCQLPPRNKCPREKTIHAGISLTEIAENIEAGVRAFAEGVRLGGLAGLIGETMTSYEVEIGGKVFPLRPASVPPSPILTPRTVKPI